MRPGAVIFDMDGVIVDSLPLHYRIWEEIGELYGFPLDLSLVPQINGLCREEVAAFLIKRYGLGADVSEICSLRDKLAQRYLGNGAPLFSGVRVCLHGLKQAGFSIGLGTSNDHNGMMSSLGDIASMFDALVCASDVAAAKPEPDIYLRCADMLRCAPKDCIVVEDSILGIESAHKGGMKVIALRTTSKDLAGGDLTLDSVADIDANTIRRLI